VLIEALIAGVPIISTDCPSGSRLANGRFGELVPVDNVAALSQAMSLALKKVPEIDKAALTKYLEKFGVDQMIEGYLAAGVVCSQEIAKATEQTRVR
jgi:glycosyltransferase involved in cell wall biosynthesis